MASVVPQNWPLITKDGHAFSALEAMEMDDSALIMSLLQDSQVEDIDDERLCSAIQSLEAEIGTNVMMNDHDHGISSAVPSLEDFQPSDVLRMKDQHFSISLDDHMDFSWINDVEMVISSPGEDEMNLWSMDMNCDYYEFGNRVEFGEAADYFYQSSCQQMFDLEEPAEQHTSLWQETYEPVFYS
ncbi:hypothetical protein ACET3Z_023075 [Daucus carota]